MSRDRANEILLKESVGVFLIRASLSQPGGFALSVRDKDKTNHYKIVASKRVAHDGYKLKIGSNEFYSMTQLIDFYKNTKLADSVLTVPAAKPMYRAKFDFKVDPSDPALRQLSFPIRAAPGDRDIVEVQHPDEQQPEIWRSASTRDRSGRDIFPSTMSARSPPPSKRLTSHSFSSMSTMVTQTANSRRPHRQIRLAALNEFWLFL
uniref:SH2 domain-containing protein n=1 Tax=Macrostomum lignano TaxID=282301 RepID=A0A1I8F7T3_9PLAT